jgi:hypothetical protein
MPIWKRKRVQFIQPSDELLNWGRNNPSKQVFCLQQTGEIFADYKYASPHPPSVLFDLTPLLKVLLRQAIFLSHQTIPM